LILKGVRFLADGWAGCEGVENRWDKFRSGAHPTRYGDRGGEFAPWRNVGKIFAML
jgi:hypothetical protein